MAPIYPPACGPRSSGTDAARARALKPEWVVQGQRERSPPEPADSGVEPADGGQGSGAHRGRGRSALAGSLFAAAISRQVAACQRRRAAAAPTTECGALQQERREHPKEKIDVIKSLATQNKALKKEITQLNKRLRLRGWVAS